MKIPKRAGYTHRAGRKSPTCVTSNRGLWLKPYPKAARWLHDYILYNHYDGDTERLASRHNLFTKEVMDDVEAKFHARYPKLCAKYFKKYGRRLNGGHMVRRVAFMYVHYGDKRKVDGVRSHEYRGVIPE